MYWDVEGKKCCNQCFQHPWLREYIEGASTETGVCQYCGSPDGKLIEVSKLSDYFENVLTMFSPSNSDRGDPLVYLLQDHWAIFEEEFFLSNSAASLLEDVMMAAWDDDSGEPPVDAHELYVRAHPVDYVERFEIFLEESAETADAEPDFPEILREDIWRYEETVPAGKMLYRARLGWEAEQAGKKTAWARPHIGPNPAGPPGRANKKGEVVLYCADHERTAIAEVRPARGFVVSMCELRVKRDLRVLDLAQSTRTINPFLEGDGLLSYWVELDDLLGRMAWTLATPLHRDDNPLDYAPSQKLSEFAKEVGFDGVRYPSAMDTEGMNLVIFDPCACDIGNSRLVKVTTVKLEYTDELWRLN